MFVDSIMPFKSCGGGIILSMQCGENETTILYCTNLNVSLHSSQADSSE